ncbi:MAG: ABC transporter ATP-binding protein/permease [Eubacterium sp.]|nr:ABC transporter ATP-binding protein/permease [Eubacterium sp.]
MHSVKRFFDFCGPTERKKYYTSVALGVFEALVVAWRIPAAYLIFSAILSGGVTMTLFWQVLAIMIVSTLLRMVSMRFSSMLQTEAGYTTCANKRMEIAEHLKFLPMGYFNENSLGNITNVTTNNMEQVGDVATRAVMLVLQGTIGAVVIDIFMLFFDWRVGLICTVGMVIFYLFNLITRSVSAKYAPVKLDADEHIVGAVIEFIQGISEARNYNLAERSNDKLAKAILRKEKADIMVELKVIPLVGFQSLILKVTGVCIVGSSIAFYLAGTMELLTTMILILCAFMVFDGLDSAGIYSALLRVIENGVNKAEAVLKTEPMDIDGEDVKPESYDLVMEDVDFAYESRKIIDDLSLTIPQNTTTAIVGPSGGGKTTVTKLLARFWDVDKGRVTLGGRDVRDYSFDSLMNNFSFVFQNVYLFEDTIANNIRFSNPDAPMEDVVKAAKAACCHDFISALPDGYETVIGENGASLSGGEKQRISIARAIMKDAPIIILDEATANVDPENEKELTEAIENLTREKTIIMIAHRLKTVKHADNIIVIDKGRIVQSGTHEELISVDGIYRNFVADRKQAVSWKLA